ncbi:hypothetical protein FBEOM_6533 [Fusarium beomiforme]|uniref:Ecp2 effector protein domain-containing protein n=1 Tax=Fusarium beomiforme TaxID=44412 RepID=A0A9P5DYJ8_9HYPO|nr:hypothetical protein FBEOM_6533 [Fusarium beomiforme]
MLFQSPLRCLLMAAVATATPLLGSRDVSEGFTGEVELFKRGAVLDKRDLELAETHGVNLTEMHKHSVLKRHDGDHVTVWVHRGFQEAEGPSIEKRQRSRPDAAGHLQTGGRHSDFCYSHDRKKPAVDEHSPTTGGIMAMRSWAWNTKGYFQLVSYPRPWVDLVVAGSNAGTNSVYRVKIIDVDTRYIGLGTDDVAADADFTLNENTKQIKDKWRCASYGWETCAGRLGTAPNEYPVDRFWGRYRARVNFEIRPTNKKV